MVETRTKTMMIGKQLVRFDFTLVMGDASSHTLMHTMIKNADYQIACYDLTNQDSFKRLPTWPLITLG